MTNYYNSIKRLHVFNDLQTLNDWSLVQTRWNLLQKLKRPLQKTQQFIAPRSKVWIRLKPAIDYRNIKQLLEPSKSIFSRKFGYSSNSSFIQCPEWPLNTSLSNVWRSKGAYSVKFILFCYEKSYPGGEYEYFVTKKIVFNVFWQS